METDLLAAIELLRIRDAQGALPAEEAQAIRELLDYVDRALNPVEY